MLRKYYKLDGQAVPLKKPAGFCFDVLNEDILYVCDMEAHCVFRIHMVSASSSATTTLSSVEILAGTYGEKGFLDGMSRCSQGTLFNCPSDIIMLNDGNLLVTDMQNHAIR